MTACWRRAAITPSFTTPSSGINRWNMWSNSARRGLPKAPQPDRLQPMDDPESARSDIVYSYGTQTEGWDTNQMDKHKSHPKSM